MGDSVSISPSDGETFKVYNERWFILFIVSVLNISNGVVWIAFSSVTDDAADYYDVSAEAINCFSLVFFVASIFPGILIMWYVDRKGLKQAILIGMWLNSIGSSVRALSTMSYVPFAYQFPISMVGQVLTACAQPFFYFIQTKVAEQWFPESQRTLATTITGLANPLGIMIGMGIPPLFVEHKSDIPFLNSVIAIPCVVIAFIGVFGVRRSRPKSPPSYSAQITSNFPYLQGVKEVFKNRAYWLLLMYIGCVLGSFSAIVTVIEEFMCAKGYSNSFTGLCASLLILFGIIGSIIVSIIVDKTKKFILVMKIFVCLFCLAFCSLAVAIHFQGIPYILAIVYSLVGLFGFSTYPVGLELGAECAFPVTPEATTTGFLMISGQVQGILYLILMRALARNAVNSGKTCSVSAGVFTPHDMTVSLLVMAGIVVLVGIIFVLLFDTEYKRIKTDRVRKVNQILGCSGYESMEDSIENCIHTDLACT